MKLGKISWCCFLAAIWLLALFLVADFFGEREAMKWILVAMSVFWGLGVFATIVDLLRVR